MRTRYALAGLVTALALALPLGLAAPARADLASEAGKLVQPAKSLSLKLQDLPSAASFLREPLFASFAGLALREVQVETNAIHGTLSLWGFDLQFVVYQKSTDFFIAVRPKSLLDFKFSKLLPGVPGIQLLDLLQPDDLVLAFALKPVDIPQDGPASVRQMFASFTKGTLKLDGLGLGLFATLDLGRVPLLKKAVEKLGGTSSIVTLRGGATARGVLSFLFGKAKQTVSKTAAAPDKPELGLTFEAALPTFAPKIGHVQLPSLTLKLSAAAGTSGISLGFSGQVDKFPFLDFDLRQRKLVARPISATLDVQFKQPTVGEPTFSIGGTLFKGQFWPILGLDFLQVKDLSVAFDVKSTSVGVAFSGTGKLVTDVEKEIDLGGEVDVPAETAGIPIPGKVRFALRAPAGQVASLALTDLGIMLQKLVNAATGSKLGLPLDQIPRKFLEVRGTEPGKGPSLDLVLEKSTDAKISATGVLNVLGQEVARVDECFITPTSGIRVKATVRRPPLGILSVLPPGTKPLELDVALDLKHLSDPWVRIKGGICMPLLFGSCLEGTISLDKRRQFVEVDGAVLFGMFKTKVSVESVTARLPNPLFNFAAMLDLDLFNNLADAITGAAASVVRFTENEVKTLNEKAQALASRLASARINLDGFHKKISDAVASEKSAFDAAQARVNGVEAKYNSEKSQCGAWPPKKWGHCIEAGALWVGVKAARLTLSLVQKTYEAILAASTKGVDALAGAAQKLVQELGTALSTASDEIATALQKGAKLLQLGTNLVAGKLEEIGKIFSIQEIRATGDLAVVKAKGKFQLAISYTVLGKQHKAHVDWDVGKSLGSLANLFKHGNATTAAEPSPELTAMARQLIDASDVPTTAAVLPFSPAICDSFPTLRAGLLAAAKANVPTTATNPAALMQSILKHQQAVQRLMEFDRNPPSVCGQAKAATGKATEAEAALALNQQHEKAAGKVAVAPPSGRASQLPTTASTGVPPPRKAYLTGGQVLTYLKSLKAFAKP